jgi:DNA-binding IclR family transcriptional regulator
MVNKVDCLCAGTKTKYLQGNAKFECSKPRAGQARIACQVNGEVSRQQQEPTEGLSESGRNLLRLRRGRCQKQKIHRAECSTIERMQNRGSRLPKGKSKSETSVPQVSKPERYSAPALEKGLDVLELLARERQPMTRAMICKRLKRSHSELFRMIQVLEYRGFIHQSPHGSGFVPTDKLFTLGMEQAPLRTMLEVALPIMRELTHTVGQSCHLSVRSGSEIVVVARMESSEQIGFTVRIGYRIAFTETASGTVLFAFLGENDRRRWLETLPSGLSARQRNEFITHANQVRDRGYEKSKSEFTVGVTDISAPILRGFAAAAALAIPFVHSTRLAMPIETVIKHLRTAAGQISASLLVSDHRI